MTFKSWCFYSLNSCGESQSTEMVTNLLAHNEAGANTRYNIAWRLKRGWCDGTSDSPERFLKKKHLKTEGDLWRISPPPLFLSLLLHHLHPYVTWKENISGVLLAIMSVPWRKWRLKWPRVASRELRDRRWEVDACRCRYITGTDASTCSRRSLSERRVGSNSGLDLLWLSERRQRWKWVPGARERERISEASFTDYSTTSLRGGLLEMQSGSWRRKEEKSCMQLRSLALQFFPDYTSNPRPRVICSARGCSRSPSWTSASTPLVAGPNNRLSSGCTCVCLIICVTARLS